MNRRELFALLGGASAAVALAPVAKVGAADVVADLKQEPNGYWSIGYPYGHGAYGYPAAVWIETPQLALPSHTHSWWLR